MSIQITAIRVSHPPKNSNITHVRWVNPQNNKTGTNSVAAIVAWLKQPGALAFVKGTPNVPVTVVNANPPYLRTVANGKETDNLLSLHRF